MPENDFFKEPVIGKDIEPVARRGVVAQMVGTEENVMTAFAASLEECNRASVFTQLQALKYVSSKMKVKKFFSGMAIKALFLSHFMMFKPEINIG